MHDAFETISNHANGCNFNLFKKISTVSEMSDGNAISDIWLNCIEEDTSFKNIYDYILVKLLKYVFYIICFPGIIDATIPYTYPFVIMDTTNTPNVRIAGIGTYVLKYFSTNILTPKNNITTSTVMAIFLKVLSRNFILSPISS